MEVERRIGLRSHDPLQALGVERLDRPVVEHSGCVDHRRQRMLVRDRRDQRRQLVAHGDVAGGDAHLTAERAQLGLELLCPLRIATSPADQQQVARAALGGQVTGHESAKPAGAAGHEHGAVGIDRRRGGGIGVRRPEPREPRCIRGALAQGQLRLVDPDHGRESAA